jgi:serine/threonine protein kinase
LKKAIKTDSRYYMFMEYCNGGDLKDLMEIKKWNLSSEIIQTIMKQLV